MGHFSAYGNGVSFGLPWKGVLVTFPVIFSCYKLQVNGMPRRDAFAFAQACRVATWQECGLLSSAAVYLIAAPPSQRGWMQAPLQPAFIA